MRDENTFSQELRPRAKPAQPGHGGPRPTDDCVAPDLVNFKIFFLLAFEAT